MHRRLCHEQSRDVRVSALTIRLPSHAIHTIGVNAREQRRDPIIHHTGRSKNALIFPQPAASCYPDSMPLTDTYPYSSASTFSQTVVTWNPLIGGSALSYEDPFGRIIKAEDTDGSGIVHDNPFRFSTHYHDDETDLIYAKNRYYDPELGRFLNRDPIEEAGRPNLYGYVDNGPINAVDPHGLFAWATVLGECAKSVLQELGGRIVNDRFHREMACSHLQGQSSMHDFDFPSHVCEGHAYDFDIYGGYEEQPFTEVMLKCLVKGIFKAGLGDVLKQVKDPGLRKLIKKIAETGSDKSVDWAAEGLSASSKFRVYALCKQGKLKVHLMHRSTVTLDGYTAVDVKVTPNIECEGPYPGVSDRVCCGCE